MYDNQWADLMDLLERIRLLLSFPGVGKALAGG